MKSHNSVFISYEAIEGLIINNAQAAHIFAYLVVAANRVWKLRTQEARCGYDSISKCIGIGFRKAEYIMDELTCYEYNGKKIISKIPTWYEKRIIAINKLKYFRDTIKEGSSSRALEELENKKMQLTRWGKLSYRWKGLPSNEWEDGIWLRRDFIGQKNKGISKSPIYRLNRRNNNILARTLLSLLYLYDYDADGVYAYKFYPSEDELYSNNGISIYKGLTKYKCLHEKIIEYVCAFDIPQKTKDKYIIERSISDAIDILEYEEILQQVVVVDIADQNKQKRICCYDLHKKGEKLDSSMRKKIWDMVENKGCVAGRRDGRSHDGIYYAVAPANSLVIISIVYRFNHLVWSGYSERNILGKREGYRRQSLEWLRDLSASEHPTPGI